MENHCYAASPCLIFLGDKFAVNIVIPLVSYISLLLMAINSVGGEMKVPE